MSVSSGEAAGQMENLKWGFNDAGEVGKIHLQIHYSRNVYLSLYIKLHIAQRQITKKVYLATFWT